MRVFIHRCGKMGHHPVSPSLPGFHAFTLLFQPLNEGWGEVGMKTSPFTIFLLAVERRK